MLVHCRSRSTLSATRSPLFVARDDIALKTVCIPDDLARMLCSRLETSDFGLLKWLEITDGFRGKKICRLGIGPAGKSLFQVCYVEGKATRWIDRGMNVAIAIGPDHHMALPASEGSHPSRDGLISALKDQQFDEAATCLRKFLLSAENGPASRIDILSLWETIHAGRLKADLDRYHDRALDAERAEDWHLAIELWTNIGARRFDPRLVALGLSRSLCGGSLYEAADGVLIAALNNLPTDTELLVGRARIAAAQRDSERHAQRWRDVMRLSPDAMLFAGVASMALLDAGDLDGAAILLDHASSLTPDSLELLVPRAVVAEHAEDWTEAVRCWTRAIHLQPDNPAFRELLGRARWLKTINAESFDQAPESAAEPICDIEQKDISLVELMSAFENLCGNCELGLVQRHFGADPVGLFRFSEVRSEKMEDLLEAEFAQLGDPDHTVIKVDQDEYVMSDDRGYFLMHTMVKVNQINADKHLKQQSARITLLRRKLLSDLRSGKKVFVCKEPAGNILDDSLYRLSMQIARYSDAVILGVRIADAENPSGTVKRLNAHIIIGHVSRLFGAGAADIDFPAWLTMLETTYRHMKQDDRIDQSL